MVFSSVAMRAWSFWYQLKYSNSREVSRLAIRITWNSLEYRRQGSIFGFSSSKHERESSMRAPSDSRIAFDARYIKLALEERYSKISLNTISVNFSIRLLWRCRKSLHITRLWRLNEAVHWIGKRRETAERIRAKTLGQASRGLTIIRSRAK